MNIEFKQWLTEQTYSRYHPRKILSSKKELNWYLVNKKYNERENWNWREIKEIYDRQ